MTLKLVEECKRCNGLGLIWVDVWEHNCPECNPSPVLKYLDEIIETGKINGN